jgi:N-methylhydantoinase B/oxoprolinase/acetone carboxylase alpha subunit
MTNSRLTDPEVLEFRFPVRVDSYEIRPGLRRRGEVARRRRRRAAHALSGADDRGYFEQWPQTRRVRHGGRRGGGGHSLLDARDEAKP